MTTHKLTGKEHEKRRNRRAIRRTLERADRDLDQQTIADRSGCSRTTVMRHIPEIDSVVETRQVGNVSLWELRGGDE